MRKSLPVMPNATAADFEASAAVLSSGSDIRIGIITLGCDKNSVDTERVLARLAAAGAQVQEGAEGADVIVINTCGFIDAAKEESVDTILAALRLKQSGQARAVVAMGCMVQRYKTELQRELPEVDLFVGLTEIDRLIPALKAEGLLPASAPNMQRSLRRLSTSTRHTSHLKISEGCDHTCAFCAIPLMRGKHRSTPIDQLVAEAQELAARGVVELNLISQDTTWYGRDLARGIEGVSEPFVGVMPSQTRIADRGSRIAEQTGIGDRGSRIGGGSRFGLLTTLLDELLASTSIPWLRLFYMYPSGIHPALVDLIAREPRILPYLDMPIQHGSDRILQLMRRPERRASILERVASLRASIRDVSLRSTVIVGFPGETDDDFREMLDLVEEVQFDYLGAFPYSIEEDTLAGTMPDQVPDSLKRERLEELLELQRSITLERNEARVGRVVTVLVDRMTGRDTEMPGIDPRGAVGRTAGQALEIDGVVYIEHAPGLTAGQFVTVELTGAMDQDFTGKVVSGL